MNNALVMNVIEGSTGLVNWPTSGWMTDPLFLKVLQHIKQNICCSKEEPILVLLDNHENHCKLDAILYCYCRQNGVICTFPPHFTHRLQPLDVIVRGHSKQNRHNQTVDCSVNQERQFQYTIFLVLSGMPLTSYLLEKRKQPASRK